MTLILGFYGSSNLVLGPNSSRILRANSWFVQDIQVGRHQILRLDAPLRWFTSCFLQVKAEEGLRLVPTLYGFLEPPPLDVLTTWSENRNVSMPSNFHQARLDGCFFRLIIAFRMLVSITGECGLHDAGMDILSQRGCSSRDYLQREITWHIPIDPRHRAR